MTVESTIKEVTKPVTEPLTGSKPNFAAFAIGGFASGPIDAGARKVAGYLPAQLNNPLVVGLGELAAAYALSRQKVKNEYATIAKTGLEVGAAVAGAQNIVLAGQNFINSRKSTKPKATARRVF